MGVLHIIIVTDVNGNSESLNVVSNFEMVEELDGAFTLKLTSYRHDSNPGHDFIMQEGLVEYDGYKFRIKQLRRDLNSIQISCISTYFDNSDIYIYSEYSGSRTLSGYMDLILTDTGWTWVTEGDIDVGQEKVIPNFGLDNVIKLMGLLKQTFGFELRIDRGNQVTIASQIGPDNEFQYRYGHNIISLTESIDTTKLKTHIEGYGADTLHVQYTSPYADNPGIGIRHAEPIHDERFTISDHLLEYIKTQLHDYPDSVIELDDAILMDKEIGERVWLIHERMGLEYQTRVVARRIKIPNSRSSVTLGTYLPQSRSISNALATQKIETDRYNTVTRSRIDQTNEKITLEVNRLDGVDSSIQSSIVVQADRITQEVTDRTSADEVLHSSIVVESGRITQEVTDRTIADGELQTELGASITVQADRITQEVTDRINADGSIQTELGASITVQADRITQEVTDRINADGELQTTLEASITIEANRITQEVTDRTNADTTLQGTIDIMSDIIALEVSARGDGDAALEGSITVQADRITQEVTDRTSADNTLQASINVQADRITTEVSNRQTGDTNTYNSSVAYTDITATNISSVVSTEVTRLDGRVDSANSLISQNADEILLRVTKDGVVSAINATAETIRISATKINLAGSVTFSDFDSFVNGKFTHIDGSGIYTGTLTADKIVGSDFLATNTINIGTSATNNVQRQLGFNNSAYLRTEANFLGIHAILGTFADEAHFHVNKVDFRSVTGDVDFTGVNVTGLSTTAVFG